MNSDIDDFSQSDFDIRENFLFQSDLYPETTQSTISYAL